MTPESLFLLLKQHKLLPAPLTCIDFADLPAEVKASIKIIADEISHQKRFIEFVRSFN